MALWADKYQPKALDKFVLNKGISDNLKKLVATGDCPHTLFYGPPGAGKRTLVMALLREIYGPGAEKIRVETKPWVLELPSRKLELELTTVSSNYHVELSPGDVGGTNDRYVVQEVIKDLAKNRPLDVATGHKGFKVLVLNEVDRLSREAQQSLRRTMEKYSAGCRLVMDPVRSRCLCVRVAAPSNDVVQEQLFAVAKKEGLQLPAPLAARIAASSLRDLRRALLTLEVCRVQQYPFREDQAVAPADWEAYVAEVAGDILQEQSAKRLYQARCSLLGHQVRGKLYELLANCIPPELLLRALLLELLKKLDDEIKPDVAALAAQYEHRLQEGQKAIFHLEAFVAQFMSRYKNWQLTAFG
ncbi:Replication factor C subunit 3 [Monoraphidium neglectum]|uniref:Replication factor C subunit 3 n=1 Tax=Monoraphidium neglectum TaxID=145388 RepID=A0A0D2L8P6_9CHLO|nr:Replication factor C subunit 3 [Monoraphidium neglectum]KIZ03184.1 Replication factor C subunit 3 [Monoraphidium neglectum]|eukprot:XP_013902203.1 Replication factor C subunit 3 [Monoraphidium neglectum]